MSGDQLPARSREAFAKSFPQLMRSIEATGSAGVATVTKDGEAVDLSVEGKEVYGRNARLCAAEQIDEFMKKPLRFYMERLELSGVVTPVGKRLMEKLETEFLGDATLEVNTHPSDSPTFLIVFGLGLGHHLKELTRRTEARWLILVEPMLPFFEASFGIVDWADLLEQYKARGGGVSVIVESDPQEIVAAIAAHMAKLGIPYADGSWVFTHYSFWSFAEARDRLHEAVEFSFINRGFFEDELVMMRNAIENFVAQDFRLLDGRPRLQRRETAAIIGAGPSLDGCIDAIKQYRDRLVLFSGGTALRALLRNGIVPDFHCELENVPGVYDVLTETQKVGDLSRITLISSATVDPRVPELFADTIFYFRDSISSTQILGGKHRIINGTSPTCINLALNSAVVMGFTEFVLFGTDCGTRPGSLRHASGTVYSEIGVFEAGNVVQGPLMQAEGNFGGIVNTESTYDWCRRMLSAAIKHYRLNVQNCSDGALIQGARPRVPSSLRVATPVVDHAAFKAEIARGLQRYGAGEMLEEADFAGIIEKTHEMFAELDALLIELQGGEADFGLVYERLKAFAEGSGARYARTESMISGSLQGLPRIAMFYGYRIEPIAERRRFFEAFMAEFRAIVAYMAKEIDALFAELGERAQSASRPLALRGGR
ncbi:MAG: motility associated factor glycosyltransferase family protein [Stellaceae bacterium]